MKKITLLMLFIIGIGYSQTSNLVATGAHSDVYLNGNGALQNFMLAPCSFSQPVVGAPNGYSITSTDPGRSVADDFTVSANEVFEPDNFSFVVALFDPNVISSTTIVFYSDNAGLPGTVISTLSSQVPVSQNIVGTAFGRNLREVVFNLSTSGVSLNGGASGTKYWVALENAIPNVADNPFWLAKDLVTGNESAYKASTNGYVWQPGTLTFGVPRDMVFLLSGDCSPASGGPVAECGTGNPQPIPASGTGGAGCAFPTLSPATVTATGNIGAASGDYILDNVQINLTHTWDSDLSISLVSPMGTSLDLSSGNGGSGDNYTNTVFMDGAPSITTGSAPFTGTFQAEGGTFAATFAGEPINGNWTLRICDGAAGDSGTLLSYCINFSEITVVGNAPTIACPADITINNTAGTCGGVANFAGVAFDVEDGNISSSIVATPASGSTFPVGDTMVELSVTDSDGNTATCSFMVTVLDNELPVAVCQDITVDLDPVTGMATITAADVDNGSTDNCSIASMSLDVSSFDCSMTGANTVVLTVTDNSGNSSTCTSTVTVQDVTAPEVFCVGGFGIFTESEDFEAGLPSGWSTVMNTGTCDWINSGDMPTGDDFPTLAMLFDDDACGSGAPASNVSLLSAVYDLTGASNVTVDYDVAFQESGTQTFTVEVFDGAAWQQIAFYDADLDPDIQSESIDVSVYVNATFQVRWTFDDNGGEWGWGAGVDNFLLSYEAASGGGLDVFLDANGMASVDPNDLLVSVNEACGYTVTAGGVGGGTTGSLSTFFIGTNGGASGWTVMYDVTVGPADIQVTELDINSTSTTAFDLDLYVLTGTYVGNETNAAAWGAVAATGSGTGAGTDLPSNVVLDAPVMLSANTTYGFAVVTTGLGQRYTNGDGTNQNFSNADLSMSLGTAVAGLFTGSVFTPRVWNGTVHYETVASSGLEFTCADLGENIVEVTVTDDSGNVSTCMAVVNVIDLIAPIITCGPEPTVSETVSDSPNLAIPDADPTGVTSTLTITEDVVISDLNVNLDVTHTWVGDVTTTITSPAGTSVTIVDRPGFTGTGFGCSGDDILATLDDAGTGPVEDQCGAGVPTIDGTFIPNNPLSAFNGESTMGDWIITISDAAGGDTGTLNSWGITYSYANTNTDIVIELGPDGTATIDPYDIISGVIEACGIATAAVDVPTVSCADIGTTIVVTAFVSDTSGNIASCSANVIVVDLLAPVLTCPADQTVDPGAGNLFYILPDYIATGEATAIDNCTDPVTLTTQV
ncbi:proprotein convertase P-domain-containing protein, partial [Aequorivita antarctica]